MKPWINNNVLLLSFSAFFADAGYQAILASFPILLVVIFGAPVYLLGLAYALMYGVGAIFGYIGGRAGDRFGQWRMVILGNSILPVISFVGLAGNPFAAIIVISCGWWAREFRSSIRRGLLGGSVPKNLTGKAFGFLHALDIGGGVVAAGYLVTLISLNFALQNILIITIIPIILSTVVLLFVNVGREIKRPIKKVSRITEKMKIDKNVLKGVLIGTSLFGFSFFSPGFPVLTLTQISGSDIYGIFSYLVFLLISALTGYFGGTYIKSRYSVKALALAGYSLAGTASLIIGFSYLLHAGILIAYTGVGLLGLSLGIVETFEPTIVSFVTRQGESTPFGYLASARSIGLFSGNFVMGVFYFFSPFDSYVYAAAVSFVAAVVLIIASRGFKT